MMHLELTLQGCNVSAAISFTEVQRSQLDLLESLRSPRPQVFLFYCHQAVLLGFHPVNCCGTCVPHVRPSGISCMNENQNDSVLS